MVDYSLMLTICTKTNRVKVGIIDYLRRYDTMKKVEHNYKKMRGTTPTIVPEKDYAKRILKAMETYFINNGEVNLQRPTLNIENNRK